MSWTTRNPTGTGWFWIVNQHGTEMCAEKIERRNGKWIVCSAHDEWRDWVDDGWLRWSIPVVPPSFMPARAQ